MKKTVYNENKSGMLNNQNRNVHIAHFEAKGLLYLWFFSFLFLLIIMLIAFGILEYQIAQLG